MKNIPTAEDAAKMSDEYVDTTVYKLDPKSESILAEAVQRAICSNSRKVELTVRGYEIEEGSFLVQKFLESKGYQQISVKETGYSCFDNNRGQTYISFTF